MPRSCARSADEAYPLSQWAKSVPAQGHRALTHQCLTLGAWLSPHIPLGLARDSLCSVCHWQFLRWPSPDFTLLKWNLAKDLLGRHTVCLPCKCSELDGTERDWASLERLACKQQYHYICGFQEFITGFYYRLTIWLWASHCTSLNLSFLVL